MGMCLASAVATTGYADAREDSEVAKAERIAWFNEAKFGLFVHWGPFSLQGADPNAAFDYFEMKENAALREEYKKYGEAFNPQKFDADKWMAAANSAGMKYVVFTSKHHDGYCLFDTALTDYDSVDGLPRKDYVRELIPAARAAGLKIGFYYSTLDWYQPDFVNDFPKYVTEYMFPQVKELCSNYGPIDCIWFDGEWDYPIDAWRSPELVKMIRELQPNALINDRLGKGERGITQLSDFFTREQPSEMNVATSFERHKPYPWEACMTIGDYWQYSIKDTSFKSTKELVGILVDVVSRGGNLLLNVGPTPDGETPQPLLERLEGMGKWMAVNGESIYGATRSPFAALPAGKCTAKANRIYIHLVSRPEASLSLPGLRNKMKRAWILGEETELAFDDAAKTVTLPEQLPDQSMTVLAIELDGEPNVE
jgi:alpha-L-fucosidase